MVRTDLRFRRLGRCSRRSWILPSPGPPDIIALIMTAKKHPPRFNDLPPSRGLGGLVRDITALDQRALLILITVPVVLTLLEYYGLPWHYTRFLERRGRIVVDHPGLHGLLPAVQEDLSRPGPARIDCFQRQVDPKRRRFGGGHVHGRSQEPAPHGRA